jgi:ribosomal protein L19
LEGPKLIQILRNTVLVLLSLYLALFAVTKVIRYPEPIAAIRLGLAPASKTPDLMPFHWIVAAPSTFAPWRSGTPEVLDQVTWKGKKVDFEVFLDETATNAFLVIRNGKITYERYPNPAINEKTVLPSYSVAKTMTSLLIGQLIDEDKIKEGDKERVQQYTGIVIMRQNHPSTASFTVRKMSNGGGVERIFPLNSPFIESIEVNKVGIVRRAKLFYLRSRTGKSARIREKIISSEKK